MDHQMTVRAFKAYLATGDQQYHPANFQKVAAQQHANDVDCWKAHLVGGLDKEARAGHPANLALAKAMRPGILPGMDGSRIRLEPGEHAKNDFMSGFFENSIDPYTQAYLRDGHYDSMHDKGASSCGGASPTKKKKKKHEKEAAGITRSPRLTHSLSDRLKQTADRIQGSGNRISHITAPPPAMGAANQAPKTGLPQTAGGLGEDGVQTTQPKNVQNPTTTQAVMAGGGQNHEGMMQRTASIGVWWDHLKVAADRTSFGMSDSSPKGTLMDRSNDTNPDEAASAAVKGINKAKSKVTAKPSSGAVNTAVAPAGGPSAAVSQAAALGEKAKDYLPKLMGSPTGQLSRHLLSQSKLFRNPYVKEFEGVHGVKPLPKEQLEANPVFQSASEQLVSPNPETYRKAVLSALGGLPLEGAWKHRLDALKMLTAPRPQPNK